MSAWLTAFLLALLALLVPSPAAAAPTTDVVFTIDAATSDPRIDIDEVARDWSKNTGITVLVGSCTGPGCFRVSTSDNPCGLNGGIVIGVGYSGCAQTQPDGSCTAFVIDYYVERDGVEETYIAKHEIGHCLGIAHLDNERAVMYYGFDAGMHDHTLTTWDRKAAQALY